MQQTINHETVAISKSALAVHQAKMQAIVSLRRAIKASRHLSWSDKRRARELLWIAEANATLEDTLAICEQLRYNLSKLADARRDQE